MKRSDIKYTYSLVPPSPLKPPMKTFLDTSQSLKENMYYSIPVSSEIGVLLRMSLEQGSKVHGTGVPGQPINPEPIVLGHLCNKFTLGLRKFTLYRFLQQSWDDTPE